MKLGVRISVLLCIVSLLTIVILTVLMSFRYHITRQNLVNERLGVIMSNISSNIESTVRMGLDIRTMNNIRDLLLQSRTIDGVIEDIRIFTIEGNTLTQIHGTQENSYSEDTLLKIIRRIRGSKSVNWDLKESGKSIVGFTIRDNARLDRVAIVMSYDPKVVWHNEMAEIKALYLRMFIGALVAGVLAFWVGFKSTRELSNNIAQIEKVIEKWQSPSLSSLDLSGVTDPALKIFLRNATNHIDEIKAKTTYIDALIAADDKKGGDNV
jgi:hypothetical protein